MDARGRAGALCRRAGRLVVAESRYLAEDAAELVTIDYQPLDVVLDPVQACKSSAPLLHPQAGTNEISVREFRYGDPDAAFAGADRRIAMTVPFPELSFTPIECYVVVAQHILPKTATTFSPISRARFRCIR